MLALAVSAKALFPLDVLGLCVCLCKKVALCTKSCHKSHNQLALTRDPIEQFGQCVFSGRLGRPQSEAHRTEEFI